MNKHVTILAFSAVVLVLMSFSNLQTKVEINSVQIGEQIWSAENLNVDTFRNGDFILYVNTTEAWMKAGEDKKPAYCYYDDMPYHMYDPYGKLYNWYAVNDPRGLTPVGWHVPSDTEWTVLVNYLGGNEIAGKKLKADNYEWYRGGKGTNESKFNAVPGSYRWPSGVFLGDGTSGHFWTSTALVSEEYKDCSWQYSVDISDKLTREFNNNENGMSVRLVRDVK